MWATIIGLRALRPSDGVLRLNNTGCSLLQSGVHHVVYYARLRRSQYYRPTSVLLSAPSLQYTTYMGGDTKNERKRQTAEQVANYR